MKKKIRSVNASISEDYYRLMNKTRLVLQQKYNIKITSSKELTKLLTYNKPIYQDSKWIKKIKKLGY